MVATFREGAPPRLRALAPGMSPTLATLDDGDLVVAYATGAAGAHRVALRRLAPDLEPRGEPFAISPEGVNAGQPTIALAKDARGLVAFLAADRAGHGSVLAAPIACDLVR
jgi:hypothetical protein